MSVDGTQSGEPRCEGLKPSRYNFFIPYHDATCIGYNSLYRSLIRFPSEIMPAVRGFLDDLTSGRGPASSSAGLSSQWVEALRDAHFLIAHHIDELTLLKFRYNQNLYANDGLSLVVLPTLWCNFSCPYCFEFKRPIHMDSAVQDSLIRWVEKRFADKRRISVAWFGGEPLLAKETIRSLTRRLLEFTAKVGAQYQAYMTTNGFYLDRSFCQELSALRIKNVQVTFDGDQPDHDALRRRTNGMGSFDQVFANVTGFHDVATDTRLVIRVNCTDDNYDGIPRLLERFPREFRRKASIFFRWVWANEASGNCEFSESRRSENPFRGLGELYAHATALGWTIDNPHLAAPAAYCEVDYLDHFTVGPDGSIYLCTHTFDSAEAIGSLRPGDKAIRTECAPEYAKWYSLNPFEDPECLSCQFLPICLGGCRKSRMQGSHECIEEKSLPDLFVRNIADDRLSQLNTVQE